MPVPIQLSHHRSKRADEEELPLVEIDMILFGWFAVGIFATWAQFVGTVVSTQQIMDNCAAFPGYDPRVGIFKSGYATVLVDL